MRKIIIILLTFLVLSSSGYATSNSKTEELVIKGYKANPEDYLKIIVTDALNSSLNVIPDNGRLDITNHLNSLFATDGGVIDNKYSQVVFSYRVIGNTKDTYTITFDVESFKNEDPLISDRIDAYYELQNLRLTYSNGSALQNNEKYETEDGESFFTTNSQPSSGSPITNGSFSATWTTNPLMDANVWTARGTVQMSVSLPDYNAAAYGRYTAAVKITLKGNG